MHKMEIILLFG